MSIKYTFYMIIIFLGVSCTNDPQMVDIYDIPDEFIFEMHQVPTPNGTQPAFKLSTINAWHCENDKINVVLSKTGKNINIDLLEIIKDIGCEEKSRRISSEVYAVISPETYKLIVSLKDQIFNTGKVHISTDQFELKMYSDYGLSIGKTTIQKIPDNYVWGYIKSHNPADKIESSLVSFLLPIIDGPSLLSAGEYGLFRIDNEGEIHISGVEENPTIEMFIVKTNASLYEIKSIVDTYSSHHQNLEIFVSSSFGVIN